MGKPGLAFGLNFAKKPGAAKPAPPRRKPLLGDDDSEDDGANGVANVREIGGDVHLDATASGQEPSRRELKPKNAPATQPPKIKAKAQSSTVFGDLASSLTSRKNAEAAKELDPSVYEYDLVYDSLKPKKLATKEDAERKPKYMRSLMQAAEVRKRDALIAEEKKIARERKAEGDEYAGKEKFVTEAYKRQQEENRQLEEEKRREEAEAKKNQGGGMSAFYRRLLDKDQEKHAQAVQAAEERARQGPKPDDDEEEVDREKAEAALARELNDNGISVAVNEEGQVVDRRQLLKGGLNVGAKKKEVVQREAGGPRESDRRHLDGTQAGRKQAMRERQSRMVEEQLEQSMKRSRESEDAQRQEAERAAKSRKTEGEIQSAKERYLARKRAAEEAKSTGVAEKSGCPIAGRMELQFQL